MTHSTDDLACDGKYCRATPGPGHAIQIALPGEEELRLCWRCYQKWEAARFPDGSSEAIKE